MRTCRHEFDQPGFCLLNAGRALDSMGFRRLMADLKQAMAEIHEARTGNTLVYLSAARFDQQTTTKPHLDGGPQECFLMLGYEPSAVDAKLEIADYSKCAFDLGLTPQEFLAKHNPMFQAGGAVCGVKASYSCKVAPSRQAWIICFPSGSKSGSWNCRRFWWKNSVRIFAPA